LDEIATYSGRGPSRLDFVLKPDIVSRQQSHFHSGRERLPYRQQERSADKWLLPNGTTDACTFGAGHINIPAAINCTVTAGTYALSPRGCEKAPKK